MKRHWNIDFDCIGFPNKKNGAFLRCSEICTKAEKEMSFAVHGKESHLRLTGKDKSVVHLRADDSPSKREKNKTHLFSYVAFHIVLF